jgi:hypothetical protein
MGAIGTRGVNGTVAGTTTSAAGGAFQATYTIPAGLKGASQIAIRMEANTGGWFAYNWFYNSSSGAVTPGTPAPTATTGPTATPGTPAPTATPRPGGYTGIPTFSILAVVKDTSVTVRTNNFPAGKTWTVRMGAIGTRGVNGTVVGTTASAAGGAFDATYTIPAGLKGAEMIAIRMEADTGGWFAYNWFFNTGGSSSPAPTVTPGGPTATPGFSGIPTFTIASVVKGTSVTITTKNFPPNTTFTARMGAFGTQGVNGTVVGTSDSGAGGVYNATFTIPASMVSASRIAIRLESASGYFAYNWFWNNNAP